MNGPIPLAYVLWEEREGPRAESIAVAVPNGSQANRISNLVPLPTSEYHRDINISGGGHPPAALLPHADTGFIFSPSLHPDKEQTVSDISLVQSAVADVRNVEAHLLGKYYPT